MKKSTLLLLIALVIIADMYCLSWAGELVSMQSDTAVLIGALNYCALFYLHYLFIKYIIKQFNKK